MIPMSVTIARLNDAPSGSVRAEQSIAVVLVPIDGEAVWSFVAELRYSFLNVAIPLRGMSPFVEVYRRVELRAGFRVSAMQYL